MDQRSIQQQPDSGSKTPTDDGEPLATIERGPGKCLRLRAKTFNDRPFIDIREWSRRDEDADWWPVKGRGISIRIRELDAVIAALQAARRS